MVLFIVQLHRITAFAHADCVNQHKIIRFDIIIVLCGLFSSAKRISLRPIVMLWTRRGVWQMCQSRVTVSSSQRRGEKMRKKLRIGCKKNNNNSNYGSALRICSRRNAFLSIQLPIAQSPQGSQSCTHSAVTHFTTFIYILFAVTSRHWWVDRSLVTLTATNLTMTTWSGFADRARTKFEKVDKALIGSDVVIQFRLSSSSSSSPFRYFTFRFSFLLHNFCFRRTSALITLLHLVHFVFR